MISLIRCCFSASTGGVPLLQQMPSQPLPKVHSNRAVSPLISTSGWRESMAVGRGEGIGVGPCRLVLGHDIR